MLGLDPVSGGYISEEGELAFAVGTDGGLGVEPEGAGSEGLHGNSSSCAIVAPGLAVAGWANTDGRQSGWLVALPIDPASERIVLGNIVQSDNRS